jgi:hypothetical protein
MRVCRKLGKPRVLLVAVALVVPRPPGKFTISGSSFAAMIAASFVL